MSDGNDILKAYQDSLRNPWAGLSVHERELFKTSMALYDSLKSPLLRPWFLSEDWPEYIPCQQGERCKEGGGG